MFFIFIRVRANLNRYLFDRMLKDTRRGGGAANDNTNIAETVMTPEGGKRMQIRLYCLF